MKACWLMTKLRAICELALRAGYACTVAWAELLDRSCLPGG